VTYALSCNSTTLEQCPCRPGGPRSSDRSAIGERGPSAASFKDVSRGDVVLTLTPEPRAACARAEPRMRASAGRGTGSRSPRGLRSPGGCLTSGGQTDQRVVLEVPALAAIPMRDIGGPSAPTAPSRREFSLPGALSAWYVDESSGAASAAPRDLAARRPRGPPRRASGRSCGTTRRGRSGSRRDDVGREVPAGRNRRHRPVRRLRSGNGGRGGASPALGMEDPATALRVSARALYEEPTLRRQFGDEYAAYCRRVPR